LDGLKSFSQKKTFARSNHGTQRCQQTQTQESQIVFQYAAGRSLALFPEEIILAIRECINGAIGIAVDDLIQEVCRLFSLKATSESSLNINHLIDSMVSADTLSLRGNKVTKGKKF
jgi:hypothetical protein